MSPETALSLAKFAGPVVALVAAIWSTTQRITREGSDGAIRLTLQGRVLIGLIALSTLVSILALGFETVVARQTAATARAEKAAGLARAAEQERRAEAEKAARDQASALARLQADSAEQRRFLEQRLMIMGKFAEQQHRDGQMSMQIARESNARLADAQRMFAQFDLVNYPLSKLEAEVSMELNLEGRDLDAFWKHLAERSDLSSFRTRRADPSARIVTFLPRDVRGGGFDPLFIDYSTTATDVRIEFVNTGNQGARTRRAVEDSIGRREGCGDLGEAVFSVRLQVAAIRAEFPQRTLTVQFAGEPTEIEKIRLKGERLSLAGAKKLVPVLTIRRQGSVRLGPRPPDRLESVSLRLNDLPWFSASKSQAIGDSSELVLLPRSGP